MRKILLAAVALLAVTGMASAAVLTVQPLTLAQGETKTLNVTVAGAGSSVSIAQVLLIIGQPGFVGGTDTAPPSPQFVGGDLGPVLTGKGAVNQYFNLDVGNGPEPLAAGNIFVPSAASAVADGVMFTFQVKANAPGIYSVAINPDNTNVNNGAADLVGGTITVTPEPAAMVLLALGGLFLRRR